MERYYFLAENCLPVVVAFILFEGYLWAKRNAR